MHKSAPEIITRTYQSLYKAFEDAGKQLESEFRNLTDAQLKRQKTASAFILTWMRENYLFEDRFNTLFCRQVSRSGSDMFTAAVALALNKYLSRRRFPDVVKSELRITTKRGVIRPDISIWKDRNDLRAIIECKTNPGWNRDAWEAQYHDRTKKVHKAYPSCSSFLCILTKKNWESVWPKFENSPLAGTKWFCLTDVWPTDIGSHVIDRILYPIEPMFISIRKTLQEKT